MTAPGRLLEALLTTGARAAWPLLQAVNQHRPARGFKPPGAPAPLEKSQDRAQPQLGWPRTTDSLCPACVKEARARILSLEPDIESIVRDHAGEIPARIFERDGKVLIEKTCAVHGTFSDVLATSSSAT